MPRKKTVNAHTQANNRYNDANTKQFPLRLNIKTDADVIDRLENLEGESKRAYILRVIREDIARNE